MKKYLSLFLIVILMFFVGCDSEHKWAAMEGTYYMQYWTDTNGTVLPIDSKKSYIKLTINEDGTCEGVFKVASKDGSVVIVDKIIYWEYNENDKTIKYLVDAPNSKERVNEVVEYGKIIKYNSGQSTMIWSKDD